VTVIEKSEVFDGADQATLHAEIGNPLLGLAKKIPITVWTAMLKGQSNGKEWQLKCFSLTNLMAGHQPRV